MRSRHRLCLRSTSGLAAMACALAAALAAVASEGSAGTAAAGGAKPVPARIRVHLDREGPKIPRTLYGIFFEEISCAGDGGLYAELVRNRSFEDSDRPEHWALVQSGACRGEIAIDDERPVSEKNPRSLRLSISRGGEGRVGVANEGWWGIPLREGETYDLSLFARASGGFSGPLAVTLESRDGKVYAAGSIEGIGEEWARRSLALVSSGTDPAARLAVAASSPGTAWIDVVSLFPRNTWKRRPNGLRPDLAELLAALAPGFCRFPGGCWVEGDTLEFALRWKRTIGDIAERRTQFNIWNYMSTNGLGYHEYLQMCEDLETEPVFVLNCGMSHREVVPMDRMGEWVQDALDAIEYANGPIDTTWGSLRAKAGHPEPFGLKYVEIGNENGGPAYEERYALFHDAIKSRFPEIVLIANVPVRSRRPDIIDEHYYSSPEFFIANATRYDSYDRKGPKIFVGEYAVTAGVGNGNLRGAVAEAAFMTGMERNADVVVLASYAPLFANVNYKRWNPDLIYFDATRSWGTPSYYVQKLFSGNVGDVVLETQVELGAGSEAPGLRGAIGLGTWATQAEYKDVKVTKGGEVLFESDFSRGAEGWKVFGGDWQVRGGAYRQSAGGDDRRSTAGDPTWSDYTLSVKARKLGGAEGFLVMFLVRDHGNWFWWNLGGWGNVRHAIESCSGGAKSIVGQSVPGRIEEGRWYDVKVELEGRRIRCYLDGRLVHDVTYEAPRPLHAVASWARASGEAIVKVVNCGAAPVAARFEISGAKRIGPRARAEVLTSKAPDDENTAEAPERVSPRAEAVEGIGPVYERELPAFSVTVLRFEAER